MKTQAITSLPPSPDDDRRSRMIKYTVAMGIRVVCVVLLVFVRGWAMWFIAAAAIILPYIAVVLANVGSAPPQSGVERPGAIVPVSRPVRFADDGDRGDAGGSPNDNLDADEATVGENGRAGASARDTEDSRGSNARHAPDGRAADGGRPAS